VSVVLDFHPRQHLEVILSRVSKEHLVSWSINIEGFYSMIRVFKALCFLGPLRPLIFQEITFIEIGGVERRIFQPYS